MGRSKTTTYRLEITAYSPRHTLFAPQVGAWHGHASDKRLAEAIDGYIETLRPGGHNAHISKLLGYMPIPHRARIVHQRTGEVAAEWVAPAFMQI